jgi:hypothetical protein
MNLPTLIEKSMQFERDEARADVYPMVVDWIERHSQSTTETIRGIATLLYVWNTRYYSSAKKGFSGAVETLQELFANPRFVELLSRFRGSRISTANLEPVEDALVNLYDLVDYYKGLGIAGTSKVLHLCEMDLFVMWDDKISRHYHKRHRELGLRHERGGGRCYAEFLREMRMQSTEVLSGTTEQIVLMQLKEMCGYRKTLAKALDEANFMTFTKRPRA